MTSGESKQNTQQRATAENLGKRLNFSGPFHGTIIAAVRIIASPDIVSSPKGFFGPVSVPNNRKDNPNRSPQSRAGVLRAGAESSGMAGRGSKQGKAGVGKLFSCIGIRQMR
jgi:hypothetical protein